jgi:hypothetical protein
VCAVIRCMLGLRWIGGDGLRGSGPPRVVEWHVVGRLG